MVYVVLTLPIAVGRMVAMTGHRMSDTFYLIAGCLLTSCGWIDALLYTLTRRVLVSTDLSTGQYNRTGVTAVNTNAARPGDSQNYGLSSMAVKDGNASTARTVTIVGGSNRLSRIVDHTRGRNSMRSRQHESILESSPTRSGSQDSIIKPMPISSGIEVVTETNIRVETAGGDHYDSSRPQTDEWNTATPKHS